MKLLNLFEREVPLWRKKDGTEKLIHWHTALQNKFIFIWLGSNQGNPWHETFKTTTYVPNALNLDQFEETQNEGPQSDAWQVLGLRAGPLEPSHPQPAQTVEATPSVVATTSLNTTNGKSGYNLTLNIFTKKKA